MPSMTTDERRESTLNLDRLSEAVRLCSACPLGTQGTGVPGMVVVGQGQTEPDVDLGASEHGSVMILGEAPGGVEMARGLPFQGGSGQLLHSLLKEAGLTSYYVSNIAKHRPWVVKGKQQAPDKVAIEACAPFLRAEFDLVKPAKLILLGKTAAKLVCKSNFSMKDMVNTTTTYQVEQVHWESPGLPTLVLYHPAHFLYNRTAPWIQKQVSEWKRAVRMFLGDRPPEYRIEKVRCETHG